METRITPQTDLTPAPKKATGVLLVVNTDDTGIATDLDFAIAVAQRDQVALTIYDRSEETWGDSQHPDGPMALDDDRLTERAALRDILTLADSQDVQVQGWVSTLPSVSAVTSAVSVLNANLIIVSDELSQKFLERALTGDSIGESLATQISRNPTLDATVVVVAADGTRTAATPAE